MKSRFIFIVFMQCSMFPFGRFLDSYISGKTKKPQDDIQQLEYIKALTPNNTSSVSQPPCNEIDWTVWSSITGKSSIGVINSQGHNVNVMMNSTFEFESTPHIERYEAFKRFKAPISNTTVPRTSWSKEPGGVITICFSQTVKEPILLLASLGSYKDRIHTTISFSEPYVVLYNGGGILADNNNSLTGREGYTLIKFPGDIKCITINSSTYENFTDLTWGIPVCPDGTPKPPSTLIAAAKPEPAPKTVEIPKPVPVVAAAKPEPAPKPVEVPKPAPVVAAVKPAPAPKPVEVPKPAPVLAVVKPKPAPKPVDIPKPAPVVAAAKPEPAPKPVDIPKPAPVVAATKPAPAPKPVEVPKPTPVVAAAKPEPTPKPVDIPKPAPIVAAVKPEPAPKPVDVPKPTPVVTVAKPALTPKPVEIPKSTPKVVAALSKSASKPIPVQVLNPEIGSVRTKPVPKVVASKDGLVSNNKLKIEVWDYDGMDYDSVSIKFNGKQVGPKSIQLQLYKMYGSPEFTYSLDLQSDGNTLEIYAISEGLKPFTTIALRIMYNDKPKKLYFTLKAKETTVIQL